MYERTNCRICGSIDLHQFLDMGMMPLANGLLDSPDAPEKKYPLTVNLCQSCGMVQLGQVVPAEELYTNYSFCTGSSAKMVEHFSRLIINHAPHRVNCPELVVEIASNDGKALASYVEYEYDQGSCCGVEGHKHSVLGIEPARNLAAVAAMNGVPTVPEFFTESLAKQIVANAGKAGLIVACNVLGHVDDLHDFMRGVKALLHPDGAFVFEVPDFGVTTHGGQYDQIYHEHLSYFTRNPLYTLLARNGLSVEEIEQHPVHGGSFRYVVKHGAVGTSPGRQDYADELEQFTRRAEDQSTALHNRVCDLLTRRVIAYGASAKGAIVLNYSQISNGMISFVIDSTPAKQGKYMPGTHQKIVPPESVNLNDYGAVLLLAWNHAEEIKAKHPEFKGEWILPHG